MVGALPQGEFRWVEESGHTPHLEQPAITSAALVAFVRGQTIEGDADTADVVAAATRYDATKEVVEKAVVATRNRFGEWATVALEKARSAVKGP